jgi:type I restriction enzyme S subunit
MSALEKLPLPLPPLAEQKRIADKLDTVLSRVDAVNARLARVAPILKRFRQSVLAAATSGRLTEDWRNANQMLPVTEELLIKSRIGHCTASRDEKITHGLVESGLHVRIEQDLPENWLRSCIGMIGVVCNGSTPSRARPEFWGGEISWVSSGEVRDCKIRSTSESITQLGFESSSVRLLPVGTVLIAMIGEGKTRGQSALLEIEATINQNVAAVVPVSELIDSQYLWYWFQSQYEANRLAGNGSGPQALNCQRVRELPVNLPPLEEQTEIVRRVETLFAFADRLEARLQAARTAAERLTPALLAKAFRGELVPQDPADEPAAELLKRLAASAPASPKRRGRPARTA